MLSEDSIRTVKSRYLNSNDCCGLSYAKQNGDVLILHLVSFLILLSWIAICLLVFQEVRQMSSELTDPS